MRLEWICNRDQVQVLPIILGMFLAQWVPGASFKTNPDFSGTPPL